MAETTLRRAIDGARLVQFHEHRDVFVTWSGGATFNVYSARGEELHEIDVFNVSDDEGRPVSREAAKEHAKERLHRDFA